MVCVPIVSDVASTAPVSVSIALAERNARLAKSLTLDGVTAAIAAIESGSGG